MGAGPEGDRKNVDEGEAGEDRDSDKREMWIEGGIINELLDEEQEKTRRRQKDVSGEGGQ